MAILNLKQLQTPKYQSLRVLQASGGWAQVYKDRIGEYGKYRTAVIFPESLLFIPSKRIYYVETNTTAGIADIKIGMMHSEGVSVWSDESAHRYTYGGWELLKTIEGVKSYEREHPDPFNGERNFQIFHSRLRDEAFQKAALFINKKDAMKYVEDKLPSLMDKVR